MELTAKQITDHIEFLSERHRATRGKLLTAGKTYRSHKVSFENGCLYALANIMGVIKAPEREQKLQEAMATLMKKG